MDTVKIRAFALSLLSVALLSGCIREMTLEDVRNMQEPQPTNWEQYMASANRAVSQGKYDKAAERYQQAMDDADAKFGPNDLHIATSACYFAKMQNNLGHFTDAERLYKRALEVQQATLKATDPDVIQTRKDLADVLLKLYKEDEAKQILAGIKSTPASTKKQKRHHR